MGDTSTYTSTKTWRSDADETLNAIWSWSCSSKEVISNSLNTTLKLCPCVSYLWCHLFHCVKQGTKKAETEDKWERKVLIEVNGRRERSMSDFSLLLSWNYFHIPVFDRRVFLSYVCGFCLSLFDFILILASLCMS